MRKLIYKILFCTYLILVVNVSSVFAQCTPASPGATACSGCTAASGDVITTTRCYSGSGTFATYTINAGGLLRVCGTLTITSLSMGTGTAGNLSQIVVESGGNLTITSALTMNDYVRITNRGTLTMNGILTIGSSNSALVTDISSARTTFNASVSLSTGVIVNRGSSIFNSAVTFNGTSTYCVEKSYTEWNQVAAWSATLAGNFIIYGGSGTNDAVINFKGTNSISAGAFSSVAANKVKLCRNGSGDNPPSNYANATYSTTSCATPVPVVLTKFNASSDVNGNSIIWQTAQEFNNSHFELEASRDGINFEKVAEIKGNGSTNTPTTYMHFDANNQVKYHPVYYRLKQVDFDGKFEYSNIIYLSNSHENASVTIFPNPLDEGTTLYATFGAQDAGFAKVNLYDLSGKLINSYSLEEIKPNGIYEIEDKNMLLPKGSYILEIITPQNVYNKVLDVK